MDKKTRFVVFGQAFLLFLAYATMARLTFQKFWNREHNIEETAKFLETDFPERSLPSTLKHLIRLTIRSYHTTRFHWFFPHIVGAFVWWNLYFLQLIPSFRRDHKVLHRRMGRVLMVCAVLQCVTGAGLAATSHSPTIKLTSWILAISVVYCAGNAWYFARSGDYAKHKYWSMKLVGYLLAIPLQRFYNIVLMACWRFGYLYDKEETQETIEQIFDDSFVTCIMTAYLLTEWYLASYYGWTDDKPKGQ